MGVVLGTECMCICVWWGGGIVLGAGGGVLPQDQARKGELDGGGGRALC